MITTKEINSMLRCLQPFTLINKYFIGNVLGDMNKCSKKDVLILSNFCVMQMLKCPKFIQEHLEKLEKRSKKVIEANLRQLYSVFSSQWINPYIKNNLQQQYVQHNWLAKPNAHSFFVPNKHRNGIRPKSWWYNIIVSPNYSA